MTFSKLWAVMVRVGPMGHKPLGIDHNRGVLEVAIAVTSGHAEPSRSRPLTNL
jgi:hypothetical protein